MILATTLSGHRLEYSVASPTRPPERGTTTGVACHYSNTIANEYNAPLNITNLDPNNNPAPGLGTAGVGVVAITNGKRILCLLEGGQLPKPVVSVGGTAAVVVIAEPDQPVGRIPSGVIQIFPASIRCDREWERRVAQPLT